MPEVPFEKIPGRVFLDTCVVNFILDYGEEIEGEAAVSSALPSRVLCDVDALGGIFACGRRASWQLAVSPLTYCEVTATTDPNRAAHLESWFFDVWHYWREFLRSARDLPSFAGAEEIRLQLLSSGMLDVLPDMTDRILVCDAVAYRCDAFCTRDWSTVLKHRDCLGDLPLQVLTPAEWWEQIRPWAGIWL